MSEIPTVPPRTKVLSKCNLSYANLPEDSGAFDRPTGELRVIIAGSRDIKDALQHVSVAARESGFTIAEVVSGTARGVDRAGELWAGERHKPVRRFAARWSELGKRAGYVRNEEMAAYADALIAVWDGQSRGTRHMIECMRRLNKPVHVRLVLP